MNGPRHGMGKCLAAELHFAGRLPVISLTLGCMSTFPAMSAISNAARCSAVLTRLQRLSSTNTRQPFCHVSCHSRVARTLSRIEKCYCQPFLQGSRRHEHDQQTDHATPTSSRSNLAIAESEMRPKIIIGLCWPTLVILLYRSCLQGQR